MNLRIIFCVEVFINNIEMTNLLIDMIKKTEVKFGWNKDVFLFLKLKILLIWFVFKAYYFAKSFSKMFLTIGKI